MVPETANKAQSLQVQRGKHSTVRKKLVQIRHEIGTKLEIHKNEIRSVLDNIRHKLHIN